MTSFGTRLVDVVDGDAVAGVYLAKLCMPEVDQWTMANGKSM